MKVINAKNLSEIKQEVEQKQLTTLVDIYEGMADMNELISKLTQKIETLENEIKILKGEK